jgi:ABC-type uncharacterized transport system permease subunit
LVLISGTPLLFATVGEIFGELWCDEPWYRRNDVIGAMGGLRYGFILTLCGYLWDDSGGLMALHHALITITLRADQVVMG